MTAVRVKLECSGRSAHRLRRLDAPSVDADGTVRFPAREPSLARDGRGHPRQAGTYAKLDTETGEEYVSWRALCPTCGRHFEMRLTRVEAIARGAAELARRDGRHVAVFDLSKPSV